MNKEEAKHFSEVLKAYSEGKEIEVYQILNGWTVIENPSFDVPPRLYRVKQELKYRFYKWDEFQKALKEHGVFVRRKNTEHNFSIIHYDYSSVTISNITYSYDELFKEFVWSDDRSPCGILEE